MRDLIKNKEYFSNILESNDKKIIKYNKKIDDIIC